jgi:hypothetical protein
MHGMVRIQVHLTEEQDRRLRGLARRRSSTRAELIRRGIELVLREEESGRDALLDLIGAAGSGPQDDLSERHDEIVYRQGESSPRPKA